MQSPDPSAAQPPSPLLALLRTMRPKQWSKNLLLFAGFLFTLNDLWVPMTPSMWAALRRAGAAFGLFCLLSSAVYILNDLKDRDKDRQHPVKRHRPLAAGHLPTGLALGALALLVPATLAGAWALRPLFFVFALGYLIMQVLYTYALKHMVILDVLIIAMGFVLRAVSGAVAIDAAISPWLYTVTLLGALFVGFSKRRHELLLLSGGAHHHRKNLAEYSAQLLDQLIGIVAAATIMAYSLYTFTSRHSHAMMLTIPFVLYGMFRYLYLVHRKDAGGSPEDVLLRDRPLAITIALWVLISAAILAFGR